jgi:hypothetical protein
MPLATQVIFLFHLTGPDGSRTADGSEGITRKKGGRVRAGRNVFQQILLNYKEIAYL